jgi:Barstar (barnase inhibitor)
MNRWVDLEQEVPGLRGARTHVLPAEAEARVRERLAIHGFEVRVIEGRRAQGEAAFFEEAARGLELPAWFGAGWDAFGDCLGELAESAARRVAVIWRDAHLSLGADVQTVLSAVVAFEAAATSPEGQDDEPVQLAVFLFGAGAGFGGERG